MEKYSVITEDMTVAYGDRPVLWDVDLKLPEGKLIAVVGPNGAGKSTLLKAALGLVPLATGRVWLKIRDDKGEKEYKKFIGYVPQTAGIDWDFPATVGDVALMGRYARLGWIKRPGKEDKKAAEKALEKVGMNEFSSRQINRLSGGQQQRVFLARALAQEAELYFLDEPFKGVDLVTEHTIVRLLKEIRDEGKTVIVVHHDLATVKDYFDWVVIINGGVKAAGPVGDIFTKENIEKAYAAGAAEGIK